MKKTFVLLLLMVSSLARSADDKNGAWLGIFSKKSLTPKDSFWTEAQFRYDLDKGGMGQTLYRFGPLRKLNDKHEIGFLMGMIQTGVTKEYRPTLQHTQQYGALGPVTWSGRSRLEARFLEDSTDDAGRFRYLIRGQLSVDEKRALVLWDEPFINLTRDAWTGSRTVDRNRFFFGTRLDLGEAKLEVGYLNQTSFRKIDVSEHILALYLFL